MKSKTVVVFGGSGVIGSAIVAQLLQLKYYVIAAARNLKNLRRLQQSFAGKGEKPMIREVDVTSRSSIDALEDFLNRTGRVLHAMVYAVGHCPPGGIVQEASTPMSGILGREFEAYLARHPAGLHNTCQRMVREMEEGGHIVVVGSAITRFTDEDAPPHLHFFHYQAAQAAVDAVARGYRHSPDIKKKNIRVHLLKPAAIDTPFHQGVPEEFRPPAFVSMTRVVDAVAIMLTNERSTTITLVP